MEPSLTDVEDDPDDALYAEAVRFGVVDEEMMGLMPESYQREGRRARRADKPAAPAQPEPVLAALSDGGDSLYDRFDISYTPARYEAVWLADSLRPLAERALIRDVMALVKGGKEANVYLCEGEATVGGGLVAAKVYRPRAFRNLRNDRMYRDGREIMGTRGETIKNQANRVMRAVNKKTSFGAEVLHISWLMHEYMTLERLYAAGASVPEPLGSGENALLMRYVGDRSRPAPVLHGVALESVGHAQRLFQEVLRNIDLMLSMKMIHGDLSAYNILYWEGAVTLIDFPQVTMAETNNRAYQILHRDVQRVCEYFGGQGVDSDADAIARRLWARHMGGMPMG